MQLKEVTTMQSNVVKKVQDQEVVKKLTITPLSLVLNRVNEKRPQELIRFRTCCADPRASK
jgi:hypothetical protein